MSTVPPTIDRTAAEFDRLPGVGPRAALRFAHWLAGQPRDRVRRFAEALIALAEGVVHCGICGGWSDQPTCAICRDPSRDRSLLCIIATSQDLHAIEDSGAFHGVYHVLGGVLDPIEGKTPETLSIPSLIQRISSANPTFQEIILALDPDVNGETTALYLNKKLSDLPVTITRLARGLPRGAQLEYADSATLTDALTNRRKTK